MLVSIIIPTYNEKDNIGRLIDYLEEKIFPKVDPQDSDMHILVVDDSSPDGTANVVKDLQKKYKNLHLYLNKKKAGLGAAYLVGMSYAVDEMKADLLIEMDADFSHDPKVIVQFLKHIKNGSDFVVGSRYIKGGSIPDNWGFHRKFLSVVSNLFIRFILWAWDVADWTGGYRALKAEIFRKLKPEMSKKEFSGYTWQIGFLHKAHRLGYKISEVPFHFTDREYGKSKIGPEYIKNALSYLIAIRIKELDRVIKFGIVGTIGFIINSLALEFFHRVLGVAPDNAAALGAEISILANFAINNAWTFRDQKIKSFGKTLAKLLQFNFTSLGSIIIQKVVVGIGTRFFDPDLYFLYFVIAVAIGMFVNYFIYTKIIWKTKK